MQGKIYTPQLIIDGRRSTVGTWEDDVREAMRDLATQADRPVSIEFDSPLAQTLAVRISFGRAPDDDLSQVWVALVQDNVVSKIGAGQNGAGRCMKTAWYARSSRPDPVIRMQLKPRTTMRRCRCRPTSTVPICGWWRLRNGRPITRLWARLARPFDKTIWLHGCSAWAGRGPIQPQCLEAFQ